MIALAIDTTSDRLGVAVRGPDGREASRTFEGARRHAGALAPLALEVLDDLGLRIDNLTALALSDGPGSFTGLRVGAAFTKAIARGRGLPVWTASTLLVRAWAARPRRADRPVTVVGVGSALRGELYVGVYRLAPGPAQEGGVVDGGDFAVETLILPTVIRARAPLPLPIAPDIVVGDVAPDAMAGWPWAQAAQLVGPPDGLPRAEALLDLLGVQGGARIIEQVGDWQPQYGRPAEAQAKWEREHGRSLVDPTSQA